MARTTRNRTQDRWLLFLALFPLGVAGWAGWTAVRWTLAYRWPSVPCVIQSSAVDGPAGETHAFTFRVAYRYTWRGRPYLGTTYQEDYRTSPSLSEAERLMRTYPAGARRICYVNPRKPTETVLKHDNVWVPLGLALGMLFGASFFLSAGCGRASLERMSGPFIMVMGLACYVVLFIPPLWNGLRSQRWTPTRCVVRSSEVRSEFRRSWPVSYRVYWPDIVYQYRWNGLTYRANTVNASDLGSLWYYGPRAVVRRYPAGGPAICHVNPADPAEAVLSRRLSPVQWLGVVPVLMVILGAASTVQGLTGRLPRFFRSPRLWGPVALGAATAVALEITRVTGTVLLRDWRAGIATGPEQAVVLVAGLVSAALLTYWIALAVGHGRDRGRRRVSDPWTPGVWDEQIDG